MPEEPSTHGDAGSPARPACTPDAELWAEFRAEGICWASVWADEGGTTFACLIYLALGHAGCASPHFRNQEQGVFKRRWQEAIAVGLAEGIMLRLVELGVRKARSLADQKRQNGRINPRRWMNVSGVWVSDWKQRVAKAIGACGGRASGPP